MLEEARPFFPVGKIGDRPALDGQSFVSPSLFEEERSVGIEDYRIDGRKLRGARRELEPSRISTESVIGARDDSKLRRGDGDGGDCGF
jgi:hypothetical protein